MAYGFDSNFGFNDPASIRRATASFRAPRPTWDRDWQKPDAPPASEPASAPGTGVAQPGGFSGGGSYASTGDAMLDMIRNTTMADALARSRGLRASAVRSAGDDPSLGAAAGLEGLLVGQGEAAQALNRGALARLSEIDARKWQEYMMLKELAERRKMAREQAWAEFLSSLGSVAGNVGAAAVGGGV